MARNDLLRRGLEPRGLPLKVGRVPLRRFDALLGSFMPSIANSSRPMSPPHPQIATTAANTRAMSSPSVLTECAIVVSSFGLVSIYL